ncbi:hypothetical protein [Paraburkholderia sp. J10-1]|uniref:hypothetical protein n=1 Tax=Paraburkholderia sp. J10-1 TaxID=2805430 RepID=UPI002AB5F38F|nr:hypothetical protein [Paraburkholderia sp. J10-1]
MANHSIRRPLIENTHASFQADDARVSDQHMLRLALEGARATRYIEIDPRRCPRPCRHVS